MKWRKRTRRARAGGGGGGVGTGRHSTQCLDTIKTDIQSQPLAYSIVVNYMNFWFVGKFCHAIFIVCFCKKVVLKLATQLSEIWQPIVSKNTTGRHNMQIAIPKLNGFRSDDYNQAHSQLLVYAISC